MLSVVPTGVHPTADFLIDFFDEFAPRYEQWAGGLHGRVAARLVEMAAPRPGWRALDVGTGTGLVANAVARAVGASGLSMGIDLSEAMMAVGRSRPGAATLLGMAAEELFFRDATFDLVTFGDSLTYLADPVRGLEEAARVLKPGGRIALSVPRRSLHTEAQERFFAFLEDFLRRHPMRIPRHRGERALLGEPDQLAALLEDLGFERVQSSALMTGWRLPTGASWIDHMLGAGPFTHAALTALGPALRRQLAGELDAALAGLGEEAPRAHHAYTMAVAVRRS